MCPGGECHLNNIAANKWSQIATIGSVSQSEWPIVLAGMGNSNTPVSLWHKYTTENNGHRWRLDQLLSLLRVLLEGNRAEISFIMI